MENLYLGEYVVVAGFCLISKTRLIRANTEEEALQKLKKHFEKYEQDAHEMEKLLKGQNVHIEYKIHPIIK